MRRRSRAGGETVKTQRHKAVTLKLRNAPKALRRRSSSATGKEAKVALFKRERDEALEQQRATSEVLRIISSSPGELKPVFDSMLRNAVRICGAKYGMLTLCKGEEARSVAMYGVGPALVEKLQGKLRRPGPNTAAGRLMRTKTAVHIADVRTEPGFFDTPPGFAGPQLAIHAGARTLLAVPMLKESELVGNIIIYRQEPEPFTEKHIELVTNFAAQAVIAIENARLLNELRQRTSDLTESLEQQTATSEVLRVISSSPGELEPVFQAMLENATRICEATFGSMLLREGDVYRRVALHNAPPKFEEFSNRAPILRRGTARSVDQVTDTRQVSHILDVATEDPSEPIAKFGGARTLLVVPMLKDNETIGVLGIYRQEVRRFTDKQIALVQNFANQAVIAIENTRLLNELRQSLQQQTATADVLKVITRSTFDLQTVLTTLLQSAARLCAADRAALTRQVGESFQHVASYGYSAEYQEYMEKYAIPSGRGSVSGRALLERKIIHISDVRADPEYMVRDRKFDVRTALGVPLLREGTPIGVIILQRATVQPFTDKQIELVSTFAAQAVIAIENTRLLNELRQRTADLTESLEQQTATSEVLSVISSSPGRLEPVFQSMLDNAVRICEAKFGFMNRYDGNTWKIFAVHGAMPAYTEFLQQQGYRRPGPETVVSRIATTKQVVHIADLVASRGYTERDPVVVAAVELGGVRTILGVPMLKEGELIGAIILYRQEVRPFTDKQIALVQNFAAQAVIAIENTRLLNELRESYGLVREQAGKLEAQSQELLKLNQQLEQRVADQVAEIERMSRLRRFLPPQVADLIVASGTEKQLESHRREITALFCDLRGYTGFSESSDPEDVMALLRDYHAVIGEIIFKYSGTLERFAGDGVMVIFNDPVPVENPALRAVLMALDMRTAIGTMIEKWRDLGHDLGFGIGIAHGFATLGTIGFEGRFDYAAIGTVSNVASRLCDEAKPGQILISPRVRLAVDKAVTVEPVGEFTLKGIRRPMTAYDVLSSLGAKPN